MPRHRALVSLLRLTLVLPLLLLSGADCVRDLSEVAEPVSEPEFLGSFSGVYDRLIENEPLLNRTIVVQLRDKALIAPFAADPKNQANSSAVDFRLLAFGTIADLNAAGAGAAAVPFADVSPLVLPLNMGNFSFVDHITCDPAAGLTSEAALLNSPQALADLVAACSPVCRLDPSDASCAACSDAACSDCGSCPQCEWCDVSCEIGCQMLSYFDLEQAIPGTCLDYATLPGATSTSTTGDLCRYEHNLGGQLSERALEIYFDQALLLPPGANNIPCPDGGPWVSCHRFRRLCDFDSRRAGVYQAKLTYDPAESRGEAPEQAQIEREIAVATAAHLPVAIFFTGEEFYFGPADPYAAGEFAPDRPALLLTNGRDPFDVAYNFRTRPNVWTTIEAAIVERPGENIVELTGTWTDTLVHSDGTTSMQRFDLSGTRLSGLAIGNDCPPTELCESPAAVCPLNELAFGDNEVRWGQWQLQEQFDNRSGCTIETCELAIPSSGLCAPLPDCGGLAVPSYNGAQRFESYAFRVGCPDGSSSCNSWEQCLRALCLDDADAAGAPISQLVVDEACAEGNQPMLLRGEGGGSLRLTCDAPLCDARAPQCPLGQSYRIDTQLTPLLGDGSCVSYECRQSFRSDIICAGADPSLCAAGETAVPRLRYGTASNDDCIEFACVASYGSSCGGCYDPSGPPCADLDLGSCGSQSISVGGGCNGQMQLACGASACAAQPAQCPLGLSYRVQSQLTPHLDNNGCISYGCQQSVRSDALCAGADPSLCLAGETALPRLRYGIPPDEDCVEFECVASYGSSCGGCYDPSGPACADLDLGSCGNQPIGVSGGCNSLPRLECGGNSCQASAVSCPFGTSWMPARDLQPQVWDDGCIHWNCERYYNASWDICGDSAAPLDACPGGAARVPAPREAQGCMEYLCQPSCTAHPDCSQPWCNCSDPDMNIAASCAAPDVVHIGEQCGGCLSLWCGAAP